MPIRLPALPALMAARALEADAAQAAQRALERVKTVLAGYDVLRDVLDVLPDEARAAGLGALAEKIRAADRLGRACRERLEEARGFRASLQDVDCPTAPVEVPPLFFEMLSPYLDDALAPALSAISQRAGCAPSEAGRFLTGPGRALAA